MSFKKPTTFKDLLLHSGIMFGISILIMVFVFHIYLPMSTNHGETISVPDVVGMPSKDLGKILKRRSLRYEVSEDSNYSPNFPPLAVLRQVPRPNTKVKENRKIYVTLNAKNPPLVRMPEVENLSLKSAQMVLKSYDLKLGKIQFIPDVFFGVIHEARMDGRSVLEGERIEKGSTIDLIAGDGHGNTVFKSPNLIGLDQEEAEVVIVGSGLKIGKIRTTMSSKARFIVQDYAGVKIAKMGDVSPGSVQQQDPKARKILKIGDPVDLWIYRPDSINRKATILDNL